ncbi:Nucleoside phosphorylase [Amycolatopsis xylanica]|uniref:Nucleoside phosphorylase n=1 Tax=Amycolatopsis xylanica TaxID=589385 RepID=A0A1H3PPV3_9PSEU|nr:5'-methylthioadenosine/S-adenosylhomocysteine nucleosidase [Amycolatopsis xylanica]SDZ02469.1 Nucleoside phosphorylase [Amycolatopsis xylanica]
MNDDLVVILTAFNEEYKAVLDRLDNVEQHVHDRGTRFDIGTVRGTTCHVAVSLAGKGNQPAAVMAERAIAHFSPTALMFVGVAGALWDTPLGDVVVATHVYGYHGGTSEDDGLKSRPRSWELAHEISQLAQHIARTGNWKDTAPDGAEVRFGPIAAGEIVQNSRSSREARWIREHYNDALAVEMEGAGVAQAGHLNGAPVVIVRGVSDKADGSKTSEADQNWQPRAAANAAEFATYLATELIKEGKHGAMNTRATPPREHVSVHGTGSTIGMVAGSISNSTVFQNVSGQPGTTSDLTAELSLLRKDFEAEHARGQLDDETYEIACGHLDAAGKALASTSPESKKKFVLALKQFSGLVAELTGLVAKVTMLVAAAKGIS